MDMPKEIFLKDYKLPDYYFDTMDLNFLLGEEKTTVYSKITVLPRVEGSPFPLVLDGVDLKLVSVKVNSKELKEEDYVLSPRHLTLPSLPSGEFTLEIVTEICPQKNTSLEGLYKSSGNFCTQCEAEGFRKITFYQDRPDIMAKYTCRIEGDKSLYPVLLSNGNLIEHGDLEGGKHYAIWEDPFKKPCYLFALVAGQLESRDDTFVTRSGRTVSLRIWTPAQDVPRTVHAMYSLKAAMKWDEDVFGLEYDLDLFNIVAVPDFNMGAMENKSLNIFNSKLVLASPETATDADYAAILGVIGHEYFHNWTGNRVTCRDWFQLSLKEGLTVFRDQEFSSDMGSRTVKRIADVSRLRNYQFPQDAGPMAHPVRPHSYIKMDNFYTVTVYEKGAEVVRMYKTLLGSQGFRKGMDLYFKRHDGQAVTCEDFFAAMRDANDADFANFLLWYSQAGTPLVKVTSSYNAEAHTYSLKFSQEVPPTPGQPVKEPMFIPVAVGFLDSTGKEMPQGLSSLASRASPAIKNLSEEAYNHRKFNKENPTKRKPKAALNPRPNDKLATPSRGKSGSKSPSLFFNSNSLISDHNQEFRVKSIDHQYISAILSREDWFILINHEYKAKRISLNPRLVVSILQNQENPLYPLRFYVWVLKINPLLAKNQSVRVALANVLNRKGPVILSVELLQDIRNSGCAITEDLLCILIGSWGRFGLAKYCAEVFGQVSFLGLSPSTRLYNAVIDALVKSNSLDLAYLKFQQMSLDNCNPDRFTYNILIHGVCRIGVVDEALRLVKQMESLDCSPNVFTYSILIDGFCNARRFDEAFRVLETMKGRNVSPSDATFRSLVHGLFRSIDPSKAFELLSRFLEKEAVLPKVVCDTILCCLSNSKMPKEAALFLRKAQEKSYFPDSSTFNIIITCLIRELDVNETCEILDSFVEQGLKPCFNTYISLIEALFKAGRDGEGNRYLNEMVQVGLVSNAFSYNMVIDCFCKASMMDRASETFREMKESGIDPNIVTFNTLISGYSKNGEIGKARALLEMLLEYGFKPNIFTFSSMIDGLCRAHQISDAFNCFNEMVEWGVAPNVVTYNILIRSLCVVGDVAKSMKLLRRMQVNGISPDVFSFNALIQSFCRMNKVEKAQNLFVSMLALGLSPDNFTYCAFIKALCESGRFDEAKELFLSVEANGCIPDSYTCNLIIDALIQQARFEEAKAIARKYSNQGISPNSIPVL